MTILRILESVHGHLGILASVALLHPAILLFRGRPLTRAMRWAIGLSSSLVIAAFGLGIGIYSDYRTHVKRDLLLRHQDVAMLFETKEHVAFAVVALATGGLVAALVAPRDAPALRRAAAIVYAAAAALCFLTAGIGTYVAAVRGFPQ